MTDLPDLSTVSGDDLSVEQLQGILNQIDLDITNVLRDGKLSALKYSISGSGGQSTDRAANLNALLEARAHYEKLLREAPAFEVSEYTDE